MRSLARPALALLLAATVSASASAQTPAPPPAPQPAAAPAGSEWSHVQVLPINTDIHIKATTRHVICAVTAVTDDGLTCNRDTGVGHATLTFTRSEIRWIKVAHRGRGAVLGGAVGAGVGALAGGIQDARSNYFAVKGAFAMIGAFVGAFAGAPTGYIIDFGAPTIYRAPK